MMPLLRLLFAVAVCLLAATACGPNANTAATPVQPDARLYGVWVPAAMQASDAPPADNPKIGFRFTAARVTIAGGGMRYDAAYTLDRTPDGYLLLHATDDAGKKKDIAIDFVTDDAARILFGGSMPFMRKVDAASVRIAFDPPPADNR